MSKVNSFIRETIALFKGDTDKALAERNYRLALNGINTQMALAESEKFQAEEKLESAKERLKIAKFPTTKIEDTSSYFKAILSAEESVQAASDKVDEIKKTIEFYKSLKAEYEEEVSGVSEESK